MGIETPLALLGLLAATLPFIIHRIRQRKLPLARLPTIALLRQAQARQSRQYRLTDLLLLALRVAVIVALCLGLAAPYWSTPLAYGDGSVVSVAIVLDDSMSMQQQSRGKPVWMRARSQAIDIVRSLPSGSEVTIVLAGSPARVWQPRTERLTDVLPRLRSLQLESFRGTALPEAVRVATQQLSGSRLAQRRLVLLTDRAAHARMDDVRWPADTVAVSVPDLNATRRPPSNLAITHAQTTEDTQSPDHLAVWVEVRRFASDLAGTEVRLQRDGAVLANADIEFDGDVARATLRVAKPAEQEDGVAWVTLPSHDDFPGDDRRGVLLRLPDAVRVLLVNGDPHPSRDRDELRYATTALRLAPGGHSGSLAVRIVDEDMLGAADLADTDVVVLANVRAPEAVMAARLTRYVQEGGGLLIAGGHRVDAGAYRAALGDVLPVSIRAVSPHESSAPLRLQLGHPMLPEGGTGLVRAHASGRLVLDTTQAQSRVDVPIRFQDGLPMLAISPIGSGRSALWATSLDADWTDLPYRPGYLPLLVELVRQLGGDATSQSDKARKAYKVLPGESVTLALPAAWQQAEVVDPEGRRHHVRREGDAARFDDTLRPGPYRVLVASEGGRGSEVPRAAFVVAPPAVESDLQPAALPDALMESSQSATSVERRQVQAMRRHALAPALFLLAALAALAEGLVRLRRRA